MARDMPDRRQFLTRSAASALAAVLCPGRAAQAMPPGLPLSLPLGLQLYSVRDQLQAEYETTLRTVAQLGYHQVEAAGFYNRTPAQVRRAMQQAGLVCVSAHYPAAQLETGLEAILDFHQKLGTARYIICAFPGFPQGSPKRNLPFKEQVTAFTLDDWKWNAEQFNRWGEQVRHAGFAFGYHNHTMEFTPQHGVVPYQLLLKETDPQTVIMELDCGWVIVGGGSPEYYLRTYADRIKMLHVKAFARDPGHNSVDNPPPATELGRGIPDYATIFRAIRPGSLTHMFVEQEGFPDMAWKQALAEDANYLRRLHA